MRGGVEGQFLPVKVRPALCRTDQVATCSAGPCGEQKRCWKSRNYRYQQPQVLGEALLNWGRVGSLPQRSAHMGRKAGQPVCTSEESPQSKTLNSKAMPHLKFSILQEHKIWASLDGCAEKTLEVFCWELGGVLLGNISRERLDGATYGLSGPGTRVHSSSRLCFPALHLLSNSLGATSA